MHFANVSKLCVTLILFFLNKYIKKFYNRERFLDCQLYLGNGPLKPSQPWAPCQSRPGVDPGPHCLAPWP